jgi:hypothetical protein
MDIKDFKGIMEAYAEVHTPQEVDEATAMAKRGYDEAPIRQKIAKSTGGGAAADRATKLADKPTYGDSEKQKARENLARKQRGDFRKTTSSSPGLHGYAHKSTDPAVKAKQAARGAQRGSAALTPNEKKQLNMGDESFDLFDTILEFLYVEGYAETFEDAEWMMANLIDEEAINIILGEEELDEAITSEKGKAKAAEMIANRTHASGRAKAGQGDNVALIKHIRRSNKDGLLGTPPNRKVAGSNWPKSYSNVGKGSKAARRAAEINKEEFEFWVDALVEEGYDLSDYTWDDMYEFYLDEAEGSYGKTPKASAAYGKLVSKRTNKPASEYSQRGEKTKKVKSAEKHMWRSLRGGPHYGRGEMTANDRERARSGAVHGVGRTQDHDYPSEGPGGVTKNPKKLRKQKAMGEIAKEQFEAWLDEAMSSYEKNRKRAAARAEARNAARDAGKTGVVPGVGYVSPRREKISLRDKFGDAAGTRMAKAKPPSGDEKH